MYWLAAAPRVGVWVRSSAGGCLEEPRAGGEPNHIQERCHANRTGEGGSRITQGQHGAVQLRATFLLTEITAFDKHSCGGEDTVGERSPSEDMPPKR